jgi:hypothetical protein
MTNKIISAIILALILVSLASFASALSITNVDTPDQIKPGEAGDVRITLENDGNNDIKDASVQLIFSAQINPQTGIVISPELPFSADSTTRSYDEIKEDKSKTFDFNIRALSNAKSGIYKIPMLITYTEDVTGAVPKTISSIISMTVNSVPILDLQKEASLLIKGQESSVTFQLVNKGLSDVSFLEVQLDNSAGYSVTSPNKIYIGTLASDDTDTAQFTVYFNPTSPNNINFPVNLVYSDVTNKQYTKQFNIDARVYSQQEAIQLGLITKSNTVTYVGLIIAVIVIYIIYRRIKKWLKNRKKAKEMAS